MSSEEYRCSCCGHIITESEYERGEYFVRDCGECEHHTVFVRDTWPDHDIPIDDGITWEELKEIEIEDSEEEDDRPKPIEAFVEDGEINTGKIKGVMKSWIKGERSVRGVGDNPESMRGVYHEFLNHVNRKVSDNFFLFMRGAFPKDRGRGKMVELFNKDKEFRKNVKSKWKPPAKGWWANIKMNRFDNETAFELAKKHGTLSNDEEPEEYVTDGTTSRGDVMEEDSNEPTDNVSGAHPTYPLVEIGLLDDEMNVNKDKLNGILLAFSREVDEILGTKPGFNIKDVRTAFNDWAQEKFGMKGWTTFTMYVLEPEEIYDQVEWMYNENDEFNGLVQDKYTYDPDRLSGNGDNGATDENDTAPNSIKGWAESEGGTDETEKPRRTGSKRGLGRYEDGSNCESPDGKKEAGTSTQGGTRESTKAEEGTGEQVVVIDLYCGAGGVGYTLEQLGINHIGVDIDDYSDTYPGAFVQGDASNLEWLQKKFSKILEECYVIIWLSPPCKAYSRASHIQHDNPREVHPTFDELNVYEVAENLGDSYIIENVVGCDGFKTKHPVELNGWGLGKGFNWKRRFHTSFRVRSQVTNRGNKDMAKIEEQGENALAEAKGIPMDWGKEEKRSAIPPVYVRHILGHHSKLDVEKPETVDEDDLNNLQGWSNIDQVESNGGDENDKQGKKKGKGLARFEGEGTDEKEDDEEDDNKVGHGVDESQHENDTSDVDKATDNESGGEGEGLSRWANEYGTTDEVEKPENDVDTHVVIQGDCKEVMNNMRANIADLVITSPPYWAARDYEGDVEANWEGGEWAGQLGHEPEPEMFVEHLMEVMKAAERILKPTGCLFVNIDDVYGGKPGGYVEDYDGDIIGNSGNRPQLDIGDSIPEGCLAGVPERFMLAMIEDGWVLRNKVHWVKQIVYEDDSAKGGVKPDAAKDRFNEKATEYMYFFTPQRHYDFDLDPVRRPHMTDPKNNEGFYNDEGANLPNSWHINTASDNSDHVAAFPEKLVERPIKAACPKGGIVVDPFAGTGTVGKVAEENEREPILIEMSDKYVEIARNNLSGTKQAKIQ